MLEATDLPIFRELRASFRQGNEEREGKRCGRGSRVKRARDGAGVEKGCEMEAEPLEALGKMTVLVMRLGLRKAAQAS